MGILFYPFSLNLSVMSEWKAHILWKPEKTNSQKHWTCLNTNCINSHVCNTGSGEPLVYKWWNRYRQTINKNLHRFTATQKDHKPPSKWNKIICQLFFNVSLLLPIPIKRIVKYVRTFFLLWASYQMSILDCFKSKAKKCKIHRTTKLLIEIIKGQKSF
jgi:hypothetical protein